MDSHVTREVGTLLWHTLSLLSVTIFIPESRTKCPLIIHWGGQTMIDHYHLF